MREKNIYSTNSSINNPEHNSDLYISEFERFFGDNFATADYYKRRIERNKKREKLNYLHNQFLEREKRRWERMDYEYLKQENIDMMNKEKNIVGRKNKPDYAFNLVNSRYDNSIQGEILKRKDEESNYKSWLRSINIDKRSNSGFNIINGQERTIFEKRLHHDIVPRVIKKNLNQINEMKNKIFINNNNFYTRCKTISHDYENESYNNRNRINKSVTTSNIMNNNGGRYRAPINLSNKIYNYNNDNGNYAKKNMIIQNQSKDNIYLNNNNYIINHEKVPILQNNINPNMNEININNMNRNNYVIENSNSNMNNNNINNNLIKDNNYINDNLAINSNQAFNNNNTDNKFIMNDNNINKLKFPQINRYDNHQNINNDKRNLIIDIPHNNNIRLNGNVDGGSNILFNRSMTEIKKQNNYQNPYNNNLYKSSLRNNISNFI